MWKHRDKAKTVSLTLPSEGVDMGVADKFIKLLNHCYSPPISSYDLAILGQTCHDSVEKFSYHITHMLILHIHAHTRIFNFKMW